MSDLAWIVCVILLSTLAIAIVIDFVYFSVPRYELHLKREEDKQ
jgi:hypothetical protein